MSYYEEPKNAKAYIKMAEGYDGQLIIDRLKDHLPNSKRILELGMGPGVDYDILRKNWEVTGSDSTQTFLDIYRKKNKSAELFMVDAVTMDIDDSFDCIYSNKVLHHLTVNDLRTSLAAQAGKLNNDGIICHTFWRGDKTEEYQGLLFNYYTIKRIRELVESEYEVLELEIYKEMKDRDSVYVIARVKPTGS